MNGRFGNGGRRGGQKGPPGGRGAERGRNNGVGNNGGRNNGGRNNGGRNNGGPNSERERPKLPPVWGRHLLEELFAGAMPSDPHVPNPGLVFDRYLKIWASNTTLVKERFEQLQDFVKEYARLEQPCAPYLKAVHDRLERVTKEFGGEAVRFVPKSRFVSGLGASHPLENGFCFDYALGVPCLPGSSVKGLCRYMAELDRREAVRRLFGEGTEGETSATIGDIIALPAYPAKWPKLEVDVINCHYPGYYASKPVALDELKEQQRVGPHEIEDPVPAFFLTVRGTKEAPFVFRLASRSKNQDNVREAIELLKEGLTELGIGAKRALGYGLMQAVP
jgi:CRISPR-associated protein Cmr6